MLRIVSTRLNIATTFPFVHKMFKPFETPPFFTRACAVPLPFLCCADVMIMWSLLHRCFTSLFYPFVSVQHTIVQMDFRWKEDHPITLLNKELAEFDVVKVEMKSKNVTYISGRSSQSDTLNPLCASHQEELSVILTQFDATNVIRLRAMHSILY